MTAKPHKRRWWKTAPKAVFFLIVLVLTLIVLTAATLSYLGRRDWARVKAELTERGEPLSLAEMLPPPIPETQNFFADSMWEELADLVDGEIEVEGQRVPFKQPRLPKGERQLDRFSRPLTSGERKVLTEAFPEFVGTENSSISSLVTDAYEAGKTAESSVRRRTAEFVLAAMAHGAPVLARLEELAGRPEARLPINDLELVSLSEFSSYFTSYAQFYRIRMWADLTVGDGLAALRDAKTAFRFQEALANSPLFISLLIRLASASITLDAIEESLRARRWSAVELAEIQRTLKGTNFPKAVADGLRGERGYQNLFWERIQGHQMDEFKGSPGYEMWSAPLPRLWLEVFGAGDEARRNTIYQNWIDALDAAPFKGLNTRTFDIFNQDVKSLKENWWNRFRYPAASIAIPNMNGIVSVAAQLQDKISQARTVCALERYRLNYDNYPEELSILVPEFLSAVPTDVATLRPLCYRKDGSDFQLWTPSWNEQDETGGGDDVRWGGDER